MAGAATALETALKRDRSIVIGGLATVIAISWLYILLGAGMGMSAFEMTRMSSPVGLGGGMAAAPMESARTDSGGMAGAMQAMAPVVWTPAYAVLMLFMWWVMMLAMMLPSAAPMILLFAAVNRKQRARGAPHVATGIFAAGYGLAWGIFSLLAVAAQWGLERTLLLSPTMVGTSVALGGAILVAAGIWQMTPLKNACLRHCRSPIHFLSHHWRKGRLGALRMGLEHGAFCLGCCWVLMALLFYGGVMNLYWIVGLCLFVLIEKLAPAGVWIGRLAGAGLIAWGGFLLVGAF
jgi:predicted metal-binding membrane protein